MPRGIGERQLQEQLRGRYGVMIPNSEGELAGKLFRIGHMGPVARPTALALGLAALGHALADLGHPADPGAGCRRRRRPRRPLLASLNYDLSYWAGKAFPA